MPRIFGQEIKGQTLWIVVGVIAAGVAVVVYVRSRAGAGGGGGAAQEAPPDYGSYGGGGGVSVAAPSDQQASSYNESLKNIQLAAAQFGLEQQKTEASQQQKQFDLQYALNKAYDDLQMAVFGQQTQVGAAEAGYQSAVYQAETKQIEKTGISCPGNASARYNPQQGWFCREKTSGGIPGRITRAVGDVIAGAGRGAAKAAEQAPQAYVASQDPYAYAASRGAR